MRHEKTHSPLRLVILLLPIYVQCICVRKLNEMNIDNWALSMAVAFQVYCREEFQMNSPKLSHQTEKQHL